MTLFQTLSAKDILSVTLILFSVIDILGSLPIIIEIRRTKGTVFPGQATFVSGIIMILFLFLGGQILKLFGVDVTSFALAGALVMFLMGLEMVLNVVIFKPDPDINSTTIFPLPFPMCHHDNFISLKAEYHYINILVGVL